MGVKGMTLKGEARVLGMEIAPDDAELFVVTERGYGKRTPVTEYPEHHRGGQGVKTIQVTEKKGPLAGMKIVAPQHELMLISEEGVVIRVRAGDISRLGRSTQGVKVMNVSDTDRVTAIARVSAGRKRKRSTAPKGQSELITDAKTTDAESQREAEAEELAAEEFEGAEDAAAAELPEE